MTFFLIKSAGTFYLKSAYSILGVLCDLLHSPVLGVLTPFPKFTVCLSKADGRNTNLLGVIPFPATSEATIQTQIKILICSEYSWIFMNAASSSRDDLSSGRAQSLDALLLRSADLWLCRLWTWLLSRHRIHWIPLHLKMVQSGNREPL